MKVGTLYYHLPKAWKTGSDGHIALKVPYMFSNDPRISSKNPEKLEKSWTSQKVFTKS